MFQSEESKKIIKITSIFCSSNLAARISFSSVVMMMIRVLKIRAETLKTLEKIQWKWKQTES